MIPCISQATTLGAPFDVDLDACARAGWTHVELWLTKLEQALEKEPVATIAQRFVDLGLTPAAAATQGGLVGADSESQALHFGHFEKRLEILQSLSVPMLVIIPDFATRPSDADLRRATDDLSKAAELAGQHGVRLALEPRKSAAFAASLDTTLALVEHIGSPHLGVCLDLFHFYTGPSKFEDLGLLNTNNLFHVQVCDLSGVPRELAADSDRILPGDGDLPIVPVLDQLARIGYSGPVSVEVNNPALWQIPADRVTSVAWQALARVLDRLPATATPADGGA